MSWLILPIMVTEMREVKHPFSDQGIVAQPGIDF